MGSLLNRVFRPLAKENSDIEGLGEKIHTLINYEVSKNPSHNFGAQKAAKTRENSK